MLRVYVRGRKDASAVKAALSRFFPKWDTPVETLHGVRGEALARAIEDIEDDHFSLFLFGKDEVSASSLELTPLKHVHLMRTRKVRNARLAEIAREVEIGRSGFRNTPGFTGDCFPAREPGDYLREVYADPANDPFYIMNERAARNLAQALNIQQVPVNTLVVRGRGGFHTLYLSRQHTITFKIPDNGAGPIYLGGEPTVASLRNPLDCSVEALMNYARVSEGFIRGLYSGGKVVVPVSGGKDSAAVLDLAVRALGAERVVAIYADTGVDFSQNREAAEALASTLGTEFVVVDAPVRALLSSRGFPTHKRRWCTEVKTAALETAVRRVGASLVLVGDRDAESRGRVMKPFVERLSGAVRAYPIRLWSTGMTQLYVRSRGLPVSPLYESGFYRVGCFICPSLRSWELWLLMNDEAVREGADESVLREFLRHRLGGG